MRTRFTLAFGLLALVAVVASALVTLHVGARGAEAEAGRRLTTAASFANTLLAAERDRNRDGQALRSGGQVFELPAPFHDVAGRHAHLIPNPTLRFAHE